MTEAAPKLELLLREALAPIEPPADLVDRLESTLASLTAMAADELDAWELSAMRDPRNWLRPAAAVVVGTTAGAGLVILRARRRAAQKHAGSLGAMRQGAERAIDHAEHALGEARRDLGRAVRARRRRARR